MFRVLSFTSRRHRRCLLYICIAFLLCLFVAPFFSAQFLHNEHPTAQQRHEGSGRRDEDGVQPAAAESIDLFGFDPRTLGKKDWHDWDQIAADKKRVGPGEQGEAYHLPADIDETERQNRAMEHGFNVMVSDAISLSRATRDLRPKGCTSKQYLERLPTVTVIMPFHNEYLNILLRSVHTIVERSPKELLKEVVLADDYSDYENLGKELEEYIAKTWPAGLVKVVRATKREGLIRTRLIGARAATGQVILFLDSHTECGYNWLPPLLEPIARDYKTVVCPQVDVIAHDTFQTRLQDGGARGAFDWQFYYKRLPLLEEDKKNPTEPFKSPVMAGGYFAISQKWFWELGGYDEGLDIWGGEQYELSFKLWQCGGVMVDAPCSHVGHIYRGPRKPGANPGVGDFVGRNYKRVAEVWMDEYKEYLYARSKKYRTLDPGDLTKQKELRDRLNCKSFKWFMEEIAFDLPLKYPPVEPPDGAKGEIRSGADNSLCIDSLFHRTNERIELKECLKDLPRGRGGEQRFLYTSKKELKPEKRAFCFDVSLKTARAPVVLYECHEQGGNQEWRYRYNSRTLYHKSSNMCLDTDLERRELYMNPCGAQKTQKWEFENVNQTLVARWEHV